MDLIDMPDLSKGFVTIPSLAVMGRTPVWVKDNKYNPIQFKGISVSPEAIAHELSKRFDIIHYLDITGIRSQKVEWNTFQRVMDEGGEVWADVGVTFSDTIIDPLMSGASYAIITTKMIRSIEEIISAYELTENLILQIDIEDGIISQDRDINSMEVRELIREISSFGMDTFIIDDLKAGRKGPSRKIISEALGSLPSRGRLFMGASDLDELRPLDAAGVDGAIISASRLMRGFD